MKRLLFLRHGKSDWGADYESDHDRPLKKRGIKASRRMGRYVTKAGWEPQLCLTSSAVRARTTVELAHEAGGWSCPVRVESSIYTTGPAGVLELIRGQDAALDSLMLIGHEPTFSTMVERLSGSGPVRMPTAALALLEFDVADWSKIDVGRARLVSLITPKQLTK